MREERLQKVLASAGVGSRRACEQLILAGRVKVNGQIVTELGTKVDPNDDEIQVDGKPVQQPKRHHYIKLHKPRGVLSDIGGDTGGRETVADLLPFDSRRLFPVGRLDVHSEGLILMTDDGELAHKLTHPRYQHDKTYYVLVGERPSDEALEQLRTGIDLPDGRTAPAIVRVVRALPTDLKLSKGPTEGVWLEIVLREGKKRQIRHMTAAVGYPTLRLFRWAIGPLTLGQLKMRENVPLTPREVSALRALTSVARPLPSTRTPPPAKPAVIGLRGMRSQPGQERTETRTTNKPPARSPRRSEERPAPRPTGRAANKPKRK